MIRSAVFKFARILNYANNTQTQQQTDSGTRTAEQRTPSRQRQRTQTSDADTGSGRLDGNDTQAGEREGNNGGRAGRNGNGTAKEPGQKVSRTPVHPHGCGDIKRFWMLKYVVVGSSPRVWGHHSPMPVVAVRWRFIPTGVGTSEPRTKERAAQLVHPHGCGDIIKGRSS